MCALIPTGSDLVLFFRGLPSGYCSHLKVKIKELDVQVPFWLLLRIDCESSLASRVPCRVTLNLLQDLGVPAFHFFLFLLLSPLSQVPWRDFLNKSFGNEFLSLGPFLGYQP